MPTWATFESTADSCADARDRPDRGGSVIIAAWTSAPSPAAEATVFGWAIWPKASCMEAPTPETTLGPSEAIAMRPAIRISAAFRSVLLATWPFLRASVWRLGVAFSVLSLAMAQATWSACSAVPTDIATWLDIQPPRNGSEAATTSSAIPTFIGNATENTLI